MCSSRRLTSKLLCCCTVAGSGWCASVLVNALRGHLAEFGVIAPQGLRNVGKLIAIVRDERDAQLPDLARQVLQVLAAQIEQLEAAATHGLAQEQPRQPAPGERSGHRPYHRHSPR